MVRGKLSENQGKSSKIPINLVTLKNVDFTKVVVRIDRKPVQALIDTGSGRSFMNEHFFRDTYKNKRLFPASGIQIVTAQGDSGNVKGSFHSKVSVQNESIPLEFFVVSKLQYPVILGEDFLQAANVKVDYGNNSLTVDMKPDRPKDNTPIEINLKDTALSGVQQSDLHQLITKFRDVFSDKPGLTHVACHEIDTGDNPPVKARAYRYDQIKEEIVKTYIDQMLEQGIIKPVDSPYASPVVLCRKKGNKPLNDPKAWQFAVDYRALNRVDILNIQCL